MSTQQIQRLQGLLEKIRRNAAAPRASAPAAVAAPVAPAAPPPPEELDLDASVDELLDAPTAQHSISPAALADLNARAAAAAAPAPAPSEPPTFDIPLDTIPPAAAGPAAVESVVPAAASEQPPAQAPSDVPPLTPAASAGTPVISDAGFAMDSEVSEVRVATPRELGLEGEPRPAELEQPEIEDLSEELSADDLVELPSDSPAPDTAERSALDFEEEEPPASSQRSRVATTLDEALADAASRQEADVEVPLKTPPPESGPQEAVIPTTGFAPMPAPDVDALLESSAPGPTPAQLGQTIELEETRGGHELELDVPAPAASQPPFEELEVSLPPAAAQGGYHADLAPPPGAREELELHLRRQEEEPPPPPESFAQLPPLGPSDGVAPVVIPPPLQEGASAAPVGPEVVVRPLDAGASAETFVSLREGLRPSTFIEVLDISLALDGD